MLWMMMQIVILPVKWERQEMLWVRIKNWQRKCKQFCIGAVPSCTLTRISVVLLWVRAARMCCFTEAGNQENLVRESSQNFLCIPADEYPPSQSLPTRNFSGTHAHGHSPVHSFVIWAILVPFIVMEGRSRGKSASDRTKKILLQQALKAIKQTKQRVPPLQSTLINDICLHITNFEEVYLEPQRFACVAKLLGGTVSLMS